LTAYPIGVNRGWITLEGTAVRLDNATALERFADS